MRPVSMMIGICLVRRSLRSCLRKDTPVVPEDPVEQHQIREHFADRRLRLRYAGRLDRLISGALQACGNQPLRDQLVFNDEDRPAHERQSYCAVDRTLSVKFAPQVAGAAIRV